MQFRRGAIILATFCLLPMASRAETCSAAATLAGFHDVYIALSHPDEQTRTTAAIALLALHLPEADPAKVKADLGAGFDIDEGRLARIIRDTLTTARSMISDGGAPLPPDHVADTEWLADIVWDSGCESAWGSDGPARRPPPPPPSFLERNLDPVTIGVLLAAAVAALAVAAKVVRQSRVVRRHELREQPRTPVSLPAEAILTTGDRHGVKILDLSLGGMRIALADPPLPPSDITIEIGGRTYAGSIAWSNEFYAGILLDDALSEAELQNLLALNASAAGGKAAQA